MNNLMELNKKLVVEALHTLGVSDYDDSFAAVGRVPGTVLLVIRVVKSKFPIMVGAN